MPKSSTELSNDFSKIAVIAPSGRGKTDFVGTVADRFKTYVISSERGLKTIADKDFDYDNVNTWEEYIEKLNWFARNYKEEGYECLAIDSFTRLAYLLSTALEGTKGKLDFDDHRTILVSLNKQLQLLTTKLECHVVITCIAGDKKDDSTGVIKTSARLSGQTRDMLPEYFDVVAFAMCDTNTEGVTQYWHQIEGDRAVYAKSRLKHLRGKRNVPATIDTYIIKGDK